uniref:HAD-IIIA family hydrolase n=1 Tax=Algoriphagus sp. TaxID=1872435 RepID=UPI004048D21E
MKQAIILAGGKGTRLKERLGDLPKPLIDICGIPLLERQILLLKSFGFSNILLLVNYASKKIIEFCNQNDNWGLDISCIDDGEPLGTAGAVLRVYELLEPEFLVLYGDTMLDVDLDRFYNYHKDSFSVATLFLHPNDHPADSDLVETDDDGQVLGFYPYPHDSLKYYPNLVNAALYWIRKEALLRWKDKIEILDFGKDLFPLILMENLKIQGYNSIEYIKDVGTPERIDKVCNDMVIGKITKSKINSPQKAVFIDRDGTLNFDVNFLNNSEQFELLPDSALAIKKINQSDYLACVITNQPVIARGECSFYDLKQIHNKLETLLGKEGAFLDRIYYCPHHPDQGYLGEIKEYKIACSCRKPKTGMIDRAVHDLNIQSNQSWMIGDTTTDMLTAKNAGLKSVLVETGYAGLDKKYWATPDYIVPNIYAASVFILEIYPRIVDFCSRMICNFSEGDIIMVGGLSRSGKSTFSNVLRDVLNNHNFNVKVISLDRWLKSEGDREDGVLGRYDLEAIEKIMNKIGDRSCRPFKLDLPGYDKLKKKQIPHVDELEIQENDIIIVEGTIALQVNKPMQGAHRLFISLNEDIRKERVIKEYLLRKQDIFEAYKIYEERQLDETPIIMGVSNFLNINMDDFYSGINNILK